MIGTPGVQDQGASQWGHVHLEAAREDDPPVDCVCFKTVLADLLQNGTSRPSPQKVCGFSYN